MPAVSLLAAAVTNGGYAAQIIIFGLGIVLGLLLLGLGELSFLGFLKFRELRQLWVVARPATEPKDDYLPDPEPPAESRQPVLHRPHLRVVASPVPATTRNGQAPNAQAALRRNAGYDDDLSA